MMDSLENKDALDNQKVPTSTPQEATDKQDKTFLSTTQEVVDKLKQLLDEAENTNKSELDTLKQVFYKLHLSDLEQQQAKFIADGGKPEDFKPEVNPLEAELNDLIEQVKAKRRVIAAQTEELRQKNLKLKLAIIDKIKDFVESPDDVSGSYKEFKELQNQWNDIRQVPQSELNKLWSNYQLYVEQFYDKLKLNIEFREYDFKKNLEQKTEICELAEALDQESDVVSAFHQLQNFHQQWREIGPVSKELRDSIWERFKEASTVINKKHQDHFEMLKEQQTKNLELKAAICEKIEAIDLSVLDNFNAWSKETEAVLALQEEWKSIGFTPRQMNNKIFERFRAACDRFFDSKNEFLKEQKNEMQNNFAKKEVLCKKAEELKESTDWRTTGSELIKLQEEWKKIGPVHRKLSNPQWKRFNDACDHFFENRNKHNAELRKSETANLESKKEIITKLKALVNGEVEADDINEQVHELIKEWNSIGHVPFKVKDEIYKEYRTLVDNYFDKVNKGQASKKINNFKNLVTSIQEGGNDQALYREKERLTRKLDKMKSDLTTYENNLGFLTLSTKSGGSLLDEINRKADKLKEDIAVLEKKIEVLNTSI